jgi:aminoglycoside phosphotransferase (APT) family kinase protein
LAEPLFHQVFAVKVHQKRVFIYMEYIEGSTLSDCDASTRRAVALQILACVTELRQLRLPRDGQIGDFPTSTHRNLKRAVLGVAPSASRARTPTLLDTAAFQRWLISEVTTRSRVLPTARMREPLLPHILSLDASAPIVFTHGDRHSGNVLVHDGQVVGIIDWEIAGWYPDWVEAQIVGHYRDTQRDEQVAELAAALGIAEEEKAWKSPYLWIHVIRMG